MKKLITSILLLSTILVGYSQNLILMDGNKNVINNVVYNISTLSNSTTVFDILVSDTARAVNSYKVIRTILSKDVQDSAQFCWGGVCYGFITNTSTHSDTLSRGDTVEYAHGGFHSILVTGPANVVRKVHYQVYNMNSVYRNDTAGFTIQYNPTMAGINELNLSGTLSEAYPNPASSIVSIKYDVNSGSQKAKITIYDMLGKEVKEIFLNDKQGTTRISTEDLYSGIYFYSLKIGDKTISTKKLVVTK